MSYTNSIEDADIRTITINRPDQLNALNRATIAVLDQALSGCRQRPPCHHYMNLWPSLLPTSRRPHHHPNKSVPPMARRSSTIAENMSSHRSLP